MNRSELIQQVAEDLNLSNRQVKAVLDATLDRIMGAVVNGDKVALKGFGTFRRTWLPPRNSRHPESGELTNLHPRFTCRFRVSENINRDLRGIMGEYDDSDEHIRARRIAHSLATDLQSHHPALFKEVRQGQQLGEFAALVTDLRRRFNEQVPSTVTEKRDYLEEELHSLLPTLDTIDDVLHRN